MLLPPGANKRESAAWSGGFIIRCKVGEVVAKKLKELNWPDEDFRHGDYNLIVDVLTSPAVCAAIALKSGFVSERLSDAYLAYFSMIYHNAQDNGIDAWIISTYEPLNETTLQAFTQLPAELKSNAEISPSPSEVDLIASAFDGTRGVGDIGTQVAQGEPSVPAMPATEWPEIAPELTSEIVKSIMEVSRPLYGWANKK